MNKFQNKFVWFFLIISFCFSIFTSCARNQKLVSEDLPVRVKMIPVTAKEIAEEVSGFGSLSYHKKFELVSSVEGIIETLNFREGDSIKRGDIAGRVKNPQINLAARRSEDAYSQALAALDLAIARQRDGEFQVEAKLLENEKLGEELIITEKSFEEEKRKSRNREAIYAAGGLSDESIREERFRMMQAENQVLLLQRELEIRSVGLREEDLVASGYRVPSDKKQLRKAIVDMATSSLKAELSAARANLEAASREMESCRLMEMEMTIRSPGPGIIGARYVEEGERIQSADRILTIMDTASLYAIVPVPESEAPKLKKGMFAQVVSGGEEINKGSIDLVSPQADSQSFTFLVRILLELSSETPLRPGMFARVSIPLEDPRKITVIPEAALVQKKENAGKVFTVQNNVLSERNVVFGALLGEEREIVSGLIPGEVVALGPQAVLKEGAYVTASE